MIYIHGLIAALLLAFFASPVLAQESCTEYQVMSTNNIVNGVGNASAGTGWQTTPKAAYVGSTYTNQTTCFRSVNTVADWSASNGCKVGTVTTKLNSACSGSATSYPPAWGSCGSAGFSLESRARALGDPEEISVNVGYYLSDQSDASASSDKYFSMVGRNICRGGQRYTLGTSMGQWLQSDDCYTVAGKEYCLVSATFTATPICGACQQSDLDPNAKPSPSDTDGDGDPDNTDPDIDGDGQPNDSDPDADGDGNPDGGGGGQH